MSNFANALRYDIAQRSALDASIGTRPLSEWDVDARIKKATKIHDASYKPAKLISLLTEILRPLRTIDTASALTVLEAFPVGSQEMPSGAAVLNAFKAPGGVASTDDASTGEESARAPPIRIINSKGSGVVFSRQASEGEASSKREIRIADLDSETLQTIDASTTRLIPLDEGEIDVPKLSFDLSRVLFNPGVYQLQDPRSRVYNFDPYLEKIMPVTEFDFDALNAYITSSKDDKLRDLAVQTQKRYVGSSSSMTQSLSQFHFLISAWRKLNFAKLTRTFKMDSENFTKLTRAPSAVFLRWRDGVYAMDADKEYDQANILMSLGKSIEKLLTLEKKEFEMYRKSARSVGESLVQKPEQYHYGEIGNFLMRSQLDAHDPRLPGSGMFDLKTRAVAAVRMSLSDHEKGQGYEIKGLYGTWESYEREYYDLIRSAFLKYSLQARMGRMDGIFVAFHNIERIFGFQYISLAEMDDALHGQTHPSLGDQEFGMSVKLMEDIFDRATKQFPEQSLRIYFEVREPTEIKEPVAYMNVFAEPVTEDEIDTSQDKSQRAIEAYEHRIFNGLDPNEEPQAVEVIEESDDLEAPFLDESGAEGQQAELAPPAESALEPETTNNDADVDFLDQLSSLDIGQTKTISTEEAQHAQQSGGETLAPGVVGFKVVVRNTVDGKPVPRVENLDADADWKLEYNVVEYPVATAVSKYRLCKARRATALRYALEKGDENDFFLARLYSMSDAGRERRRQLDALDAQRERVVLYDTED